SDASIPGLQITTTTPRPAYPRTTMLIWQVLAFVAVTLLLAAMAFTVVFWVAYRAFGSGGLVAEGSRVLPSVSVGIEEGWDGGSPLPPAWTEQPVAVDELSVRGAGSGRGETAEFAAERSRQVAVYHLVQYLAQQLQATPVAAALGADPGEGGAEAVSDQFLADVGAWATPERVNQAVKRDATGYTVATQHQLDRTIVQRTVEFYAQTQEFRGLRVGRRFPFRGSSSSGVVVVRAESWFKGVSPGDTLFEIGDQPVTTLDDFVRIATASWRDTAEGGSLGMWVEHDGQRSRIDFVRPSATKRETKIELLPLELPR
ncbi:MAG: hypothetical protein ABMB14_32555, partial [Myxococcota bacterium]